MANVMFKFGLQSAYESAAKQTDALYFITDTQRIYKGSDLIADVTPSNVEFTTTEPQFATADANKLYVYTNTSGNTTILVKGTDSMVTVSGGELEDGSITFSKLNTDAVTTSSELTSGELPDSDTTLPTAAAVKDAIETAIAGVTSTSLGLDNAIVDVSADRSEDNSGTVLTFTPKSGEPKTVTVADLFLTSASYDPISHNLTLVVQGGDSVVVDLTALIPQAINTEDVQLADTITVTAPVGNFTRGQEISVTDLQTFLVNMLSQDSNPTTTQPSVSVSLTGAGAKEVGTEFTPSWSVTLDSGSYSENKDGAQPTNVTVTSYAVTDTNSDSADTQTGSFTQFTVADDTSYRVSATVAHTAGAVPTTYLGQPYPAGQIQAGSKSGQSSAVTGFRKGFYGSVSSKDATIDSAFVRGLSNSTNSAPANGNTWTIQIPVGTLRVAFAYPATLRDVTTVVDAATKYDVKTAFTKSTVSVEGANSYSGINYKVYVTDFANPTINLFLASSWFRFNVCHIVRIS